LNPPPTDRSTATNLRNPPESIVKTLRENIAAHYNLRFQPVMQLPHHQSAALLMKTQPLSGAGFCSCAIVISGMTSACNDSRRF
jgi:hypothetical protein